MRQAGTQLALPALEAHTNLQAPTTGDDHESKSMPRIERMPDQDFWSDVYRGRRLAVFNHHGRWHAYLDHTFQPNVAVVINR
jgi:hypothetical protein